MKIPKPGRLYTINDVVYRAKKRVYGCIGCAMNDLLTCPNCIKGEKKYRCDIGNTIFIRL